MRLNNRGVTLIEIIVSVSLISIVLIFLFRLLVTLKEVDDKSLSRLEYLEKTTLIIKNIQDEIKDKSNCVISSYGGPLKFYIYCNNESGIQERVVNFAADENKKEITLTIKEETKTYKFPEGSKINNTPNMPKDLPDNTWIRSIDITDDKGNIYPIEISYIDPKK